MEPQSPGPPPAPEWPLPVPVLCEGPVCADAHPEVPGTGKASRLGSPCHGPPSPFRPLPTLSQPFPALVPGRPEPPPSGHRPLLRALGRWATGGTPRSPGRQTGPQEVATAPRHTSRRPPAHTHLPETTPPQAPQSQGSGASGTALLLDAWNVRSVTRRHRLPVPSACVQQTAANSSRAASSGGF